MHVSHVAGYFLVIIVLVLLAALITNDYFLTLTYSLVITGTLLIKKERLDLYILAIGFTCTLIGESFFIGTGIETFTRKSLFGIMPLWLPFLWAFIFLAMKRVFWLLVKDYWHVNLK
jgi:hypothetical protein